MDTGVSRRSAAGLLSPRSVAVIGASEDLTKFGGRTFKSLVDHGYKGSIYPINPKRDSLRGIKAYPSIGAAPAPVDMVVMAVPRDAVKAAVQECGEAGAKAAIVITAKFSDAGPEGAALEREIVEVANAHSMRIIGPNCLGIISPANDLVLCASPALFVDSMPKGEIGLVSQSGALMATIFDRAMARGIGFSHCFSIGNQADMDLCDFVDYLIDDDRTKVICSYIEGLKDPARFMETARRAHAAGKPWLAVKAGRTSHGAAAAFSHTASVAGSYEAFSAACRECGVLTMDDTDAMILLAQGIGKFPQARPDTVAIVTTSGGGGAITADRLTDLGIPLARFEPETAESLRRLYPDNVAGTNPIDMGSAKEGGSMVVGSDTLGAVLRDPSTDIILSAITTAPDVRLLCEKYIEGTRAAEADGHTKPHIIVMQPGHAGDAARDLLRREGAVYTDSLDDAIRVIEAWRRMAGLKMRPAPVRGPGVPAGLDAAVPSGALDEAGTKALLAGYGIPINRGEFAKGPDDALAAAQRLTGPFVVKVVSKDIVHKSDVGGVVLDLDSAEAVSAAVATMAKTIAEKLPDAAIDGFLVQEMRSGKAELLIGGRNDPQFGPIVVVGAGGVLVELLHDVAVARAPVSSAEARAMIESLQVAKLMKGYRGAPPLDIEAASDALMRASWLLADLGDRFLELDINPLLVGEVGKGCVAVDGRMLLADA